MAKPKKSEDEDSHLAIEDIEIYTLAKAQKVWAYDETGHVLSVEEQLFVRSYIVDRNEVAAMRRLGYSDPTETLKRRAKVMLLNPEVQGAISKLAEVMMKRLEIEADNVNKGIAAIAFSDVTEIMHFDGLRNNLMPSHLWPEHIKKSVSGIKAGQFGIEIKFYDKQKSLEFLSKQLGLNRDEENAAIAQANAAANMAISKILDVVARKQEMLPARVVESEGVEV